MTLPYFKTTALSLPLAGQLVTPIELDFTAQANGGQPIFDLTQELMILGGMGFVSGIFIDNGLNNNTLTLAFANGSNQGHVLRIPGKTQTWQPLLLPDGRCQFTAASVVTAALKVELHLVNFPVMPQMWNAP